MFIFAKYMLYVIGKTFPPDDDVVCLIIFSDIAVIDYVVLESKTYLLKNAYRNIINNINDPFNISDCDGLIMVPIKFSEASSPRASFHSV